MGILHLKDGVISGMILGDGYLHTRYPSLELSHTAPQTNYLTFKLNLAQQFGYDVKRRRNTTKNTSFGIFTYCNGVIKGNDILKFYSLPLDKLLYELNPLGLLLWWLDDGSLTVHQKQNLSVSRFGYLNTQGHGHDGNLIIQQALFQKFGLETAIHIDTKSGNITKSNHYRIYINATNLRRLIDLVREFIPWIPNDMLYKLNMKYVVNRLEKSEQFAEFYNF